MASGDTARETAVDDNGMVTIPVEVRRRLDLGPGDKLRWRVSESEELHVEVLRQREGVFDDFEPVDGGETDAVEAEREFGAER
jgi:AbrB family looped-hinge helix DNA binding protein